MMEVLKAEELEESEEAEEMESDIRSSAIVYSSCTLDSLWIVFYFYSTLSCILNLFIYVIFGPSGFNMSYFAYRLYDLNLIT